VASPNVRVPIKVLFTAERIAIRISELADEIRVAYGEDKPVLVSVLKGSIFFLADLARALGEGYAMDFMAVSSYKGSKSSGEIKINMDLATPIEGRNVLLVEDIVDTGVTLNSLADILEARRPASLKVVSLLFKPEAYVGARSIDFIGFRIPPHFVVGYGMDIDEDFRNLPYVGIVQTD
jgi:hypoxanthine phosphoribosyltransferase